MLTVQPTSLQSQRIGLVFGSKNEAERIERYHREPVAFKDDNPLFAERPVPRPSGGWLTTELIALPHRFARQ